MLGNGTDVVLCRGLSVFLSEEAILHPCHVHTLGTVPWISLTDDLQFPFPLFLPPTPFPGGPLTPSGYLWHLLGAQIPALSLAFLSKLVQFPWLAPECSS